MTAEAAPRGALDQFIGLLITAAVFCFAAIIAKLLLPFFAWRPGSGAVSANLPVVTGILAAALVSWRLRRRAQRLSGPI